AAPGLTLAHDLVQAAFEHADAVAEQAAVGLELRLTRSAQADTTALALQVRPAADQPRRQMGQLRELYLQLALEGLRAPREDVENQTGAVQHPGLQHLLEVAFLAGAQGVIEDDQLRTGRDHAFAQGLGFAGTDEQPRARLRKGAAEDLDDLAAGGTGQFLEFGAVGIVVAAPVIERDQDAAFATCGSVNQKSGSVFVLVAVGGPIDIAGRDHGG